VRLDRVATETGTIFRDASVDLVLTSANGTYVSKIRGRRTAGFVAYAWPLSRMCTGSRLAPRGCASDTIAGVESDPVTVGVP
jgi:hypothetical protein